jgi:hypothetical protein
VEIAFKGAFDGIYPLQHSGVVRVQVSQQEFAEATAYSLDKNAFRMLHESLGTTALVCASILNSEP